MGSGGYGHVLVVEHDANRRQARRTGLEQAGYSASEAADSADALNWARGHPGGAVIVVGPLPEGGAASLCRTLKTDPATREIAVLQTAEADGCGADASLPEPVDPQVLITTVGLLMRIAAPREPFRRPYYRRMIELAQQGIGVTDAAGRILYANSRLAEMLGCTPEELTGTLCFDWVLEEDRGRLPPLGAGALEGAMQVVEFRMRRADARVIRVRLAGTALHDPDGTPIGTMSMMADITAESEIRAQLETERSRLAAILANVPATVIIADAPSGEIIYCDDASKPVRDWIPQEPLARAAAGEIVEEEVALERLDGTRAFVSVNAGPVRNTAGRIEAAVAVCYDVTGRRSAEQALKRSEYRLRRLVDSNIIGVAFAEGDLFVEANDVFLEMVGYTREDLAAGRLSWVAMTPPEYHQRDVQAARELEERGACAPYEKEYLRQDGSRVPVLIARANYDGKTDWVSFAVNLTTRKRMEAELQLSNDRFRLALQGSPIAVWSQDLELRYTWGYNPRGFDPARVLGKTDADLFGPEQGAQLADFKRSVIASGGGARREFTLRVNNRPAYYEMYAEPLREKGEIAGVTGVCIDITEQKLLEQRLHHAAHLESIGRLGAGIAHDFNNLLSGIMGGASFALENMRPFDPARPMLEMILDCSQRAAHITTQLADYAGKGRFILERVDLSSLVDALGDILRSSVPQHIDLRYELPTGLPVVEADRRQLQGVVVNLVLNAAEAIGAEGGAITLRTGVQPAGMVFLEVSDTGCGMDERTRDQIFDPFFTTKFVGRGLGLSAVDGIVRSHGGSIEVSSTPGSGSVFRVLLPAK
ncbi:MAG TPA: PAS domain S-box protein [Bryobacteraceae bacterium]|nr:PAS domain S-box protein [Bryobacteraceae bacterium]